MSDLCRLRIMLGVALGCTIWLGAAPEGGDVTEGVLTWCWGGATNTQLTTYLSKHSMINGEPLGYPTSSFHFWGWSQCNISLGSRSV
ncbi:hypothetical protein EDB19DRAFT_1762240, partial [Suillus lakei]